jgi:trehalose-6-phosphate synthase
VEDGADGLWLQARGATHLHGEFDDYLMENFSCRPVYLDGARHSNFYNDFCKHYLWPLVPYLLPLSPAMTVTSASTPVRTERSSR